MVETFPDVVGATGILDLADRRLPQTVKYTRPIEIALIQRHKKIKAAQERICAE